MKTPPGNVTRIKCTCGVLMIWRYEAGELVGLTFYLHSEYGMFAAPVNLT